MSRNRAFSFLIALALLSACRYVHAISYKVTSVTSNAVEIGFALSKSEVLAPPPNKTFILGFDSDPSLAPAVSATGTPGSVAAVLRNHGSFGKRYLQWFSFSPYGATSVARKGTLRIDFGQSAIISPSVAGISIRSGLIGIPLIPKLRKSMAVTKPPLLFRRGLRIEVSADGIQQISGASLAAAGVPISSILSRNYRLFSQGSEVPLWVPNEHGATLGTADGIMFYGTFLHGTTTYFAQFSNTNVYWLTWESGAVGLRYAPASGAPRLDPTIFGQNAVNPARDFQDTIHIEQDNLIEWFGTINAPTDLANSPDTADSVDNWYWGPVGTDLKTEFSINLPAPSLAAGFGRIRIAFMGLSNLGGTPANPDHKLLVLVNNNTPGPVLTDTQYAAWSGQTPFVFVSDSFPVSKVLTEGINTLSFIRSSGRSIDLSALNWVEIEYLRTFAALGDRAQFHNDPRDTLGVFQFTVRDFSSSAIDLWDLTRNRVFSDLTVSANAAGSGKGYVLSFQDSLFRVTRYVAQAQGQRISPSAMVLDTVSDAWEFPQGLDYIIVTRGSFIPLFAPLVAAYSKAGMLVKIFDIQAVYNRFANGIKDPEAIRTMLRYVYGTCGNRPPRYLLLGGDATSDLDKMNQSRTIVPTHLSRLPGWGPSANDGYFGTIGDDNIPEFFVGRFPAENETQVKTLVDKTVRYLRQPLTGFWRDNGIFIGGFEPDFTAFNNDATNNVVWPSMNVVRMDADTSSPWFKNSFIASRTLVDAMNSGAYFINFDGHGGGDVWSDNDFFALKDTSRLYNGQWGGGGKLPIVFSFTCLTGFFESVDYHSLGEDIVRERNNGAITFFGASAYTSKPGNIAMNRILLDKAVNDSFASVGELIWSTKVDMLARYDFQYLPLIREYNLLGDPAIPWRPTADTLKLTLNKSVLQGHDTLKVHGSTLPVKSGSVKLRFGTLNESWREQIVPVNNGAFDASFTAKDSSRTAHAWVRAYAWNDSAEVRGWTDFSKDSLLVTGVTITPAQPLIGDTVTISCTLSPAAGDSVSDLHCLYAVGSPSAIPTIDNSLYMRPDTANRWTGVTGVPLLTSGAVLEVLFVKFRLISSTGTRETDPYVFPIKGLPDLQFTGAGPVLSWTGDSLAVDFSVFNNGSADAPPFRVAVLWGLPGSFGDTIGILQRSTALPPGASTAFHCPLPDTQGSLRFTVVCNPGPAFRESQLLNNQASVSLKVVYADLLGTSDTLHSPGRGLAVSPTAAFKARKRCFLFVNAIPQSRPYATESSWIPLTGDSVAQFAVACRGGFAASDTLQWTFSYPDTSRDTAAWPSVVVRDSLLNVWRTAGSPTVSAPGHARLATLQRGPLGLAKQRDRTPPQIRASVNGRELTFIDYAAKDKPFNLFITDPTGVLPSSIVVSLNGQRLDSTLISTAPRQGDLSSVTLTAYPPRERAVDSLTVTAADLAGNQGSRTFVYEPGQDLTIRFLSCHPNPFSAKQANGATIQNVRFAFLLTDVANTATLTIYTMSGHTIRQWALGDIIGYQEVEWDGKTQNGNRIANGTYYVKLTAAKGGKKVQTIIRIAKLEGY